MTAWIDRLLQYPDIIDEDGITLPKRSAIQFVGAEIEDDDVNQRTVVTVAGEGGGGSSSEYANGVADLAALRAIPLVDREDRQIRYVEDRRQFYANDPNTGTGIADDGDKVVKPNDVLEAANDRWYRVPFSFEMLNTNHLDTTSGNEMGIQNNGANRIVTYGDAGVEFYTGLTGAEVARLTVADTGVTVPNELNVNGSTHTNAVTSRSATDLLLEYNGAIRAKVTSTGLTVWDGAAASEVLRATIDATGFTGGAVVLGSDPPAAGAVRVTLGDKITTKISSSTVDMLHVATTTLKLGQSTSITEAQILAADKVTVLCGGNPQLRIESGGLVYFHEDLTTPTFYQPQKTGDNPAADLIIKPQEASTTSTGSNRDAGNLVIQIKKPKTGGLQGSTLWELGDDGEGNPYHFRITQDGGDVALIAEDNSLDIAAADQVRVLAPAGVALNTGSGTDDGNIALMDNGTAVGHGGGERVMSIRFAETAPTSNPTGGIILWVDPATGDLKYRIPAGTVKTITAT